MKNHRTTKSLMDVALGRRPAALYVKNARLVNVYTGEILDGQGVATWGERIAYVGETAPQIGGSTQVIDAGGRYLTPGFIDVHGHLDFFQHPLTLAEAALPTGTTGAYTESHDLISAVGTPGLDLLLDLAERIPFHLFIGLPPATPQFPEWEGESVLSPQKIRRYLRKKRVLGLSELIPWVRLLSQENQLLDELEWARALGKRIEGHTSGVSGVRLAALVAAGLTSCHESISAQDVVDRLRLGLYTMMRHGSIRADMPELARAVADHAQMDTGRLMLTPDSVFPSDLTQAGYMDGVIATAVGSGIPPVKAIQMCTLNPATYLGLDSEIGGIAPGRYADLLLVGDLRRPTPDVVVCRGRVVASEGKLLGTFGISLEPWTSLPWRDGRWPSTEPTICDFLVPSEAREGSVTVPVMHLEHKVLTQRRDVVLPVLDGLVCLDPEQDIMKMSVLNKPGDGFVTAFVSGFKARFGALATTMAHDHHHATVIGSREEDMVRAIARLGEIGGGMAIVDGGQVVAEMPFPIGGVLPAAPLSEVAAQMNAMAGWLSDRGCPLESPLFTLAFSSFASLPALRMTPSGLLDVKAGKIIFP